MAPTLRLSTRFLFALLLLPCAFVPAQAQNLSAAQAGKWREVTVPTGPLRRQALWCGATSTLVIVQGSTDPQGKESPGETVSLVEPARGTAEKVAVGPNYRFLNCSQDGRLIFFDEFTPRPIGGLYAYDRGSKHFALVLSEAHRTPLQEPLSPDGRVILAKSGAPAKQVSLPDGRTAEVVQSRINPRYALLGWVADGYRLDIARSAGNFPNGYPNTVRMVYDLVNRTWYTLKLEGNGGANFIPRWARAKDRRSIYFLSLRPGAENLPDGDSRFDLYKRDYSENARATLLLEGVNEFDPAASGEIVFNYHDVHMKRRGLYLADAAGKRVDQLTTVLDVEPAWSADGTMIKFVRAPKATQSEMTQGESVYRAPEASLNVLVRQ
jgi:hypothetical protein